MSAEDCEAYLASLPVDADGWHYHGPPFEELPPDVQDLVHALKKRFPLTGPRSWPRRTKEWVARRFFGIEMFTGPVPYRPEDW